MSETLLSGRAWLWIAAALYLAGFVLGVLALLRHKRDSRALVLAIMAAGFVVQTIGLYVRGRAVGGCPLGNTFEILQFTAWSATALYLAIGAAFRLSLLGGFTAAFVAATTLLSITIPSWDFARTSNAFGNNPWLEFHAALALFSYGVFGLLALTSGMFLLQWFSLKRQRLGGLYSLLPSISELGRINLRLHLTGVVLLAASLIVGSLYWMRMAGAVVNTAKIILTVIWLFYVATLLLHKLSILPARRLAWSCIVLFAIALLSLGFVNTRHVAPTASPSIAAHQP